MFSENLSPCPSSVAAYCLWKNVFDIYVHIWSNHVYHISFIPLFVILVPDKFLDASKDKLDDGIRINSQF